MSTARGDAPMNVIAFELRFPRMVTAFVAAELFSVTCQAASFEGAFRPEFLFALLAPHIFVSGLLWGLLLAIPAAAIAAAFPAKPPRRVTTCQSCGYSLSGIRADVCPECGVNTGFRRTPSGVRLFAVMFTAVFLFPILAANCYLGLQELTFRLRAPYDLRAKAGQSVTEGRWLFAHPSTWIGYDPGPPPNYFRGD